MNRKYASDIRNLTTMVQRFENSILDLAVVNESIGNMTEICLNDRNTLSNSAVSNCLESANSIHRQLIVIREDLGSSPVMNREQNLMFDIVYAHDVRTEKFLFKSLLEDTILPRMKYIQRVMLNISELQTGERQSVLMMLRLLELCESWDVMYDLHAVLHAALVSDPILAHSGMIWDPILGPSDSR